MLVEFWKKYGQLTLLSIFHELGTYSGMIFGCKDLPEKVRKQERITATLSWDALYVHKNIKST